MKIFNPAVLSILYSSIINESVKGLDTSIKNSLEAYIEDYYVYALDIKNFEISGVDEASKASLFRYLKKTKYEMKKKRAKRLSVRNGVGAIAFTVINNKTFYDSYQVQLPFTTVGDKIVDIYLFRVNDTIIVDGANKQAYYHYYIKNGNVCKEKVYRGDGKFIGISSLSEYKNVEVFTYPFLKEIPVALLPNDENYNGVFKNLESLIATTAKHGKSIHTEWQYDKTLMEMQSVNTSGISANELQTKIENGEEQIFENSKARGIGAPLVEFFGGGGVSSQIATKNYETFKREVLFYSLSWSIVSDGKTNKHGAEVLSNQVNPINKIEYMLELTESFITDFLRILTSFLAFTSEADFQLPNDIEIDINYSEIINRIIKSAQLPNESKKPLAPPKALPNIEEGNK